MTTARGLFDVRGIDRVTIAEIVSVAGIRASTLYEYFSNKNEIVWALVEEARVQSSVSIRGSIDAARGAALAKISALLKAFGDELIEYPSWVRFMAQFDTMYAIDWSVERLVALEGQLFPGRFEELGALIREGVADGSLRPDLDPNLTMHSVLNAVIGAQRRLASLGDRVEKECSQPIERLFAETARIVLLGLRTT